MASNGLRCAIPSHWASRGLALTTSMVSVVSAGSSPYRRPNNS
jgi:hypothetical protein